MTDERYTEYTDSRESTIHPDDFWSDSLFVIITIRKGMAFLDEEMR